MTEHVSGVDLRIVMPVHNGENHLAEAIESVLSHMPVGATLVAIDDGSVDNSAAVLRSYSDALSVVTHERSRGISAALNAGIFMAPEPEFVAIVEHDDVVLPGRFEGQLDALAENAELAVVGSCGRYVDAHGRSFGKVFVGPKSRAEFMEARARGELLLTPHACAMYRFAALRESGGYDTEFDGAQDVELMNRLVYRHGYELLTLTEFGFMYRLHDTATSFGRFHFQRNVTRYVRYRNAAWAAGNDAMAYSEWQKRGSAQRRHRARHWRHDLGALQLRRSALHAIQRRVLRSGVRLVAAAALHPRWVMGKLVNQARARQVMSHGS